MPGLYTHTAILDGAVLSASVYNGDHQNHINNREPSKVDDLSGTITEFGQERDPGELGSEILAISMAEEIKSLRFAIAEMKIVAWYPTAFTRTQPLNCLVFDTGGGGWPNAATTHVHGYWRVPGSYASGNLTFQLFRRANGTGTAVMNADVYRFRNGSASSLIQTFNANYTDSAPGFGDITHEVLYSVTSSNFQVGDVLLFDISRLGSHVDDTFTGTVFFDGTSIAFVSIAGRP